MCQTYTVLIDVILLVHYAVCILSVPWMKEGNRPSDNFNITACIEEWHSVDCSWRNMPH